MIVFSTKRHPKVAYLQKIGEKILFILGKNTYAQNDAKERAYKSGVFQVCEIEHALDCLNSYPNIVLEDENNALESISMNINESYNSEALVKFNKEPVIWQFNESSFF